VYIATSVDGYIATPQGGVDWLHTAGNPEADMSANPDMGFKAYIDSVDCMIMGRKCMDMIASMNLTPEQWPYGELPIVVLSRQMKTPPDNMRDKVEMFSGELPDLLSSLSDRGLQHAYVDGGATITDFLNQQLINEMTITQAPILLGEGLPLFGHLHPSIRLTVAEATAFPNDFIQTKYQVTYQ